MSMTIPRAILLITTIGGDVFASIFLAGLVVAQFASGLAAQASASRLMFAMGRDDVFPKRIFGLLHPKYRTPAITIVLTGLIGLAALRLDVATSTSFIDFGAFTAFTFVNLCVISLYLKRRHEGGGPLSNLLAPAIGALVCVWR